MENLLSICGSGLCEAAIFCGSGFIPAACPVLPQPASPLCNEIFCTGISDKATSVKGRPNPQLFHRHRVWRVRFIQTSPGDWDQMQLLQKKKNKKQVGKRCSNTTAVAVNLAPEQPKSSWENRYAVQDSNCPIHDKNAKQTRAQIASPPLSELCCKHTTHLHHLCKVQFSCFYRRLCLRVECWGFPETMWPVRPQRHKWRPSAICKLTD